MRVHGVSGVALQLAAGSVLAESLAERRAAPVTRRAAYMPGLDMLRGCAAMAVLLFHLTGPAFQNQLGSRPVGDAFGFGHSGVDLFFVLSGFIILYSHADDFGRPERLLAFVWKRASRIYPAFWIVTLAYAALALASHAPITLPRLVHSLLLLPGDQPVLAVAWTLSHELLFYGVVCVAIATPALGALLGGLWLGGSILFAGTTDPTLDFVFSLRHFDFLIGGAAAWAVMRGIALPMRTIGAAGLALFTTTAILDCCHPEWPNNSLDPAYGLASGLLVWSMAAASLGRGLRVPKLLRSLGAASYSIYLTHLLGFSIVTRAVVALHLPAILSPFLLLCLVVLAVTAVGIVFHALVERPLLRLCRGGSMTRSSSLNVASP